MTSHIPLVEHNHVIGLDGKPLSPMPVNAWSGLPFEVHPHIRQGEVADRYNPHPLLLVHIHSRGRSRIQSGQSVFEVRLEPGQVDVFAAGFRMDHGWWDCTPGEVLAIDIDPERARTYLHDDAVALDPSTRLAVRDPIIERLATCMRGEVEAGCPSGRLFADSLSVALLARLRACYGADDVRPRPIRRFTSAQLQVTIDFIDAHLGADLTIATLAQQVSVSPCTFSRLFKATTDSTAHAFVLTRRIERKERLLKGDLSLSEISLAVGFSSQSHFTEAFRRRTGRTPLKARRGG